MLLVSQFRFVYWYNIVLVVLTRSASSVDVECMLSITGQILNGKQSSLHWRSQDFVCGALFFREKVVIF